LVKRTVPMPWDPTIGSLIGCLDLTKTWKQQWVLCGFKWILDMLFCSICGFLKLISLFYFWCIWYVRDSDANRIKP
jgi:hypothetical protein